MLSYRHIYHAGNFADVVKHAALTLLLQSLHRKDTPFCVLDTHAGTGRYDLHSAQAQKTAEYREGIARVWQATGAPPELTAYLRAVQEMNPGGALRYYPGSPRLAHALLRPQDRLVLSELNRADYESLRAEFAGDRQVSVHCMDAYQGLRAFLPPRERRGLVLVDPAFERQDEYERLVRALREAWQRWPTGIYAVWYPIMTRGLVQRFHQGVVEAGIRKVLSAELCVLPDDDRSRLSGSGMLIVNPPWQFDAQMKVALAWLHRHLAAAGQGRTRVEWLVEESTGRESTPQELGDNSNH